MPRAAKAPMTSAGTHGGQGTWRPARAGMCSTWTGRPARASSSRMPRARFSAPAGAVTRLAGPGLPAGTATRPTREGRASAGAGAASPAGGSAGNVRGPAGGTGVIVDTGFQCVIRWGMLGGMISYRHDTRAWLNAAEEHALGSGYISPRAGAGRFEMTPCMALEDLWI